METGRVDRHRFPIGLGYRPVGQTGKNGKNFRFGLFCSKILDFCQKFSFLVLYFSKIFLFQCVILMFTLFCRDSFSVACFQTQLRSILQSFAFLNQCSLLNYCRSDTQVVFTSNVAASHEKFHHNRSTGR